MNKNGFAISILLYSLALVIISLVYMLLGIMKTRYQIENDLRNNIISELNNEISSSN